MGRVLSLSLFLGWLILGAGGESRADAPAQADYASLYAELLLEYTQSVNAEVGTRVDYSGLGGEPRWDALIGQLAEVDPSRLSSREEELAFWINAYNILAIDLVVRHYPVESIRDIGSIFRSVWKREAGRIGGRGYSLDEIEDEILRPMRDPRIHGAIVCASISCPNLARTPYRADRLDAQLRESIRAWLARPEKGFAVDRAARGARLSRVFKWFADDFGGRRGVLDFVQAHLPEAERAWLEENRPALGISYFDYDWGLND